DGLLFPGVTRGHSRREGAPRKASRHPKSLDEFPFRGPDQDAVLLEWKYHLEVTPKLGSTLGLRTPSPTNLGLGVSKAGFFERGRSWCHVLGRLLQRGLGVGR